MCIRDRWYSVLVPPYEYGVVVGGFLVNIPGGKEKARHIFINAEMCIRDRACPLLK